ncbi:TPA: hypothetical protein ACSP3H_004435 [Aeromonas veronii]
MSNFIDTVKGIDWNARKDEFFAKEDNHILEIEKNLQILAHWAKSLETIYPDNFALPFLREAQVSAQDFISVYSLSLYKNSASSMRTIFESILYFSYFKDHSVELKSVTRDKFHLSRSQIINYHIKHTDSFGSIYDKINLNETLDSMYSEVSNIVHSSQPGVWHQRAILGGKVYNSLIAKETVRLFTQTIKVINLLLLCTLTYDEWLTVPLESRKIFIKNITKEQLKLINKHVV